MLRSIALVLAVSALVSCASVRSLPESEIKSMVMRELMGQSRVDPLMLDLATDYSSARITLNRQLTTSSSGGVVSSAFEPDSILGIDFGNGLFLDSNGNLAVLPGRYIGVDDTVLGTTTYRGWEFTAVGGVPVERKTVFEPSRIEITTKGRFLGKESIVRDSKSAVGRTESLFFDGATTRIQPTQFVPLLSSSVVWEEKPTGLVVKSGPFVSNEYHMVDGRVIEERKRFVVENNGEYLRFSRLKGNDLAFRIYRNEKRVLVIDEVTGDFIRIEISENKLSWKEREHNMMGATEKLMDFSFTRDD